MAVEPAKIQKMMEGRTLEKDNIKRMYDIVQKAESPEEKKEAAKHAIMFAGQLPLLPDYKVDFDKTRKLLLASVPYDSIDEYMSYLFQGLGSLKLLLEKGENSYQVNSKYERPLAQAIKVVRAHQVIRDEAAKQNLDSVKKLYQTGTKYYHSGQFEEALESFRKAAVQGDYRMAYYSLALMYREGKGVDRDLKKALYYACNALSRGARIADALADDLLETLDSSN